VYVNIKSNTHFRCIVGAMWAREKAAIHSKLRSIPA
jgi:hypothetical protein